MDKTKNTNPTNDLTADDIDMLRIVLQKVRGSYPDAAYRQADFLVEAEAEA